MTRLKNGIRSKQRFKRAKITIKSKLTIIETSSNQRLDKCVHACTVDVSSSLAAMKNKV